MTSEIILRVVALGVVGLMLFAVSAHIWRTRNARALLGFLGLFAIVSSIAWLEEGARGSPEWIWTAVAAATIILVVTLLVWFVRAAIRYWEYPYMRLAAACVAVTMISAVAGFGEEAAGPVVMFGMLVVWIMTSMQAKYEDEIDELRCRLRGRRDEEDDR